MTFASSSTRYLFYDYPSPSSLALFANSVSYFLQQLWGGGGGGVWSGEESRFYNQEHADEP
jgi:hypothetical protein